MADSTSNTRRTPWMQQTYTQFTAINTPMLDRISTVSFIAHTTMSHVIHLIIGCTHLVRPIHIGKDSATQRKRTSSKRRAATAQRPRRIFGRREIREPSLQMVERVVSDRVTIVQGIVKMSNEKQERGSGGLWWNRRRIWRFHRRLFFTRQNIYIYIYI